MSIFFKNAIVYECSNIEVLNNINNELLQKIIFKPCGSIDTVKGGLYLQLITLMS